VMAIAASSPLFLPRKAAPGGRQEQEHRWAKSKNCIGFDPRQTAAITSPREAAIISRLEFVQRQIAIRSVKR
jgi:hypothetical protein